MAVPLIDRLKAEGKSEAEITRLVRIQGRSDNSFSDVVISIQQGLLSPEKFNLNVHHGLTLVTGALHGRRFRNILSHGLDINPARIQRVGMADVYGSPDHPYQKGESAAVAVVKELGAIALTNFVLRYVRPGNLEDLIEAEEHFVSFVRGGD